MHFSSSLSVLSTISILTFNFPSPKNCSLPLYLYIYNLHPLNPPSSHISLPSSFISHTFLYLPLSSLSPPFSFPIKCPLLLNYSLLPRFLSLLNFPAARVSLLRTFYITSISHPLVLSILPNAPYY